MLSVDIPVTSVYYKYHPKYSVETFRNDSYKPFINDFMLSPEDVQKSSDVYKKCSIIYGLTLASSGLMAFKYFNQIPGLRYIESRSARLLWKSSIVIGSMYLTTLYVSQQFQILRYTLYDKYKPKYRKYKMTGNLLDLNPNAQLVTLEHTDQNASIDKQHN